MTKEEVIKTIFVALIGAFSKSLFDSLIAKYLPDKKKINSFFIKVLNLGLRYGMPMYFLTKAFFENLNVDKYFIFRVSIFTTVLFFNLLFDIFSYYFRKQKEHFDRLLTVVETKGIIISDLERIVDRLTDSLSSHVEITKQIVDKMPDREVNGK